MARLTRRPRGDAAPRGGTAARAARHRDHDRGAGRRGDARPKFERQSRRRGGLAAADFFFQQSRPVRNARDAGGVEGARRTARRARGT